MREIAQAIKNLDAQILRCRHALAKFGDLFIQIFMVERLDHFALNKRIEVAQICNHSGCWSDAARHRNFHNVVMPMPVRIVAFPEDALVLFLAELRAMQAMRRGKGISPCQKEFQFGAPVPFPSP